MKTDPLKVKMATFILFLGPIRFSKRSGRAQALVGGSYVDYSFYYKKKSESRGS
jgi:hypothetical protein